MQAGTGEGGRRSWSNVLLLRFSWLGVLARAVAAFRVGAAGVGPRQRVTRDALAVDCRQPQPMAPTVTPTPAPVYPPLDVVYLSRSAATTPIYLFQRDFGKKVDPRELAVADQGIASFAWAPDGTVGAALVGGTTGRVVAIEPKNNKRALIDGADDIAFGQDASKLYVVKVTLSGTKDKVEVLSVGYASGKATSLTSFSYPHPADLRRPASHRGRLHRRGRLRASLSDKRRQPGALDPGRAGDLSDRSGRRHPDGGHSRTDPVVSGWQATR